MQLSGNTLLMTDRGLVLERVRSRRFAEANAGFDAFFKNVNDTP